MNEEMIEQMFGSNARSNPIHESVWVNAAMSALSAGADALEAAEMSDEILESYKLRFDVITTGVQ